MTGLNEEHYETLVVTIENHRKDILERNASTNVVDRETIEVYNALFSRYRNYFLQVTPKLYYDDIGSKNVMIHQGKFNGLVDLDFLSKGDYLQAIGAMLSDWFGNESGEFYIKEIMRLQRLDDFQEEIVCVYAIMNLVGWISEEGIRFNGNSTGEVNWINVQEKKKKVMGLYTKLN